MWSNLSTPKCLPERKKKPMSIQSLTHKCSLQPQTEYNLHVHRKWMNKQTVIYPYICNKQQVILPEKEWNFAICNNMDGFKGYKYGIALLICGI